MKHISIIVPLGQSSLANIEGSLQILSEVNVVREARVKFRYSIFSWWD